jgi:hypothetical protein
MKTTKILSSIVISFSISACFNVFSTEKDKLADTVKINNILTLKPTDNKKFLVAMNGYRKYIPVCNCCGTRTHSTSNCDEDSDVSVEFSDKEFDSDDDVRAEDVDACKFVPAADDVVRDDSILLPIANDEDDSDSSDDEDGNDSSDDEDGND